VERRKHKSLTNIVGDTGHKPGLPSSAGYPDGISLFKTLPDGISRMNLKKISPDAFQVVQPSRNHHDGKRVLELYYDCYRGMAVKELRTIVEKMVGNHTLKRIWITHRTGRVPIGEASIILAVSSAHRNEAFAATAEAMDLIKQDVPIWKKESFEHTSVWKEEIDRNQRSKP
jgi:molybdopterin synthase catalytic subunit